MKPALLRVPLAAAAVATLVTALAACDRNKGPGPAEVPKPTTTPSTTIGTEKGVLQGGGGQQGMEVRTPGSRSGPAVDASGASPTNSLPSAPDTTSASAAVQGSLPGGGLPQPASGSHSH
jgi:hypothetical protein